MERKKCSICEEEKELTEFYSQNKRNKKGGEYIYYIPYCKGCATNKAMKWRKENPDNKRDNDNKYYKTKKGQEANNRKHKKYRESGKLLAWQRSNKDKITIYNQMHKTHDISSKEWEDCKDYFNNSCAYCGLNIDEHYVSRNKKMIKSDLNQEHVDHTGENDLSNCVPSCKSCNSKKWVFSFEEWYSNDNPIYDVDRYNKILKWLSEDYKRFIEINIISNESQ